MIGRGICKIITSNVQNSSFIQCGKKNFIRGDHLHDTKFQSCFLRICSFLVSNVGKSNQMGKYGVMQNSVSFMCRDSSILQLLKQSMSNIPITLKEHSVQVVKMCTRQCECVIAHRIRRGQQMFSLYTRLWDEVALRNLISKIKKQFARRGKELLLSTVGVSAYNWDKMRITDQEMLGYTNDIEQVYHLRDTTVTCAECHKRVAFDMKVPGISYCQCSVPKVERHSVTVDWVPFLERKDVIVWRKEDPGRHGLYCYRVLASYNDVTAQDFLCVQLDVEYRREWDRTAVELTVLDSDPSSNSDVIYWVMKWPRMFSNRDYVFNRRFRIDEKEKVMIVLNRCTEHPQCPIRNENIRVKDYWSSMVIRPYKNFNEPGIEFCLTYYDDPGVSIPSGITSWVAGSGLPDYLTRLRDAARQLGVRRKCSVYDWNPLPEPKPEFKPEPEPKSKPQPKLHPLPSPAPVLPDCSFDEPPDECDSSPKVCLTSNQFSHWESHDGYLQLNAARLFL